VLDAASRLGDAQSREVNALSGYEISLIDAAFATGTVVGGTRIRWDELPARNPSSVPMTGNDGEIVPVDPTNPIGPAVSSSPAPDPAQQPAS
jgi:hypothetical protein